MRWLLPFALLLASCAPRAAVQAPTAPTAQSVDAQLAGWLLTAQNGIESTKALVPQYPGLKDPLNRVIAAYNVAEAAYLSYHAAIASGTAPPDAAALTMQVQQLLASITALEGLYK